VRLIFLLIFILGSSLFAQEKINSEIEVINETELNSIINNRNGKNLLVNVWATWCVPCRDEFPDLVKLYSLFSNSFDFVGLSVDYPEDIKLKVLPFIIENNIQFPIYVSGFNKDEILINFFSSNWNGAIPATFIYDKTGEQVKILEGKQSFQLFKNVMKTFNSK